MGTKDDRGSTSVSASAGTVPRKKLTEVVDPANLVVKSGPDASEGASRGLAGEGESRGVVA